jgi:hypothetical protein
MVTPVCTHVGFDSMGCGYKSAWCERIDIGTSHLWTGLCNSASSLQITARLGASHTAFRRDSSRQGWKPAKPNPMSIGSDRLTTLVQTRRQWLKLDSLDLRSVSQLLKVTRPFLKV